MFSRLLVAGLKESTRPALLGFGLLSLSLILVAIGVYRVGQRELRRRAADSFFDAWRGVPDRAGPAPEAGTLSEPQTFSRRAPGKLAQCARCRRDDSHRA